MRECYLCVKILYDTVYFRVRLPKMLVVMGEALGLQFRSQSQLQSMSTFDSRSQSPHGTGFRTLHDRTVSIIDIGSQVRQGFLTAPHLQKGFARIGSTFINFSMSSKQFCCLQDGESSLLPPSWSHQYGHAASTKTLRC